MEILDQGEGLFTTRAASGRRGGRAGASGWMQERQAGVRRALPRPARMVEPVRVMMVDELAALTAYSTIVDCSVGAEAALNLLCTRAVLRLQSLASSRIRARKESSVPWPPSRRWSGCG